MAEKYVRPRIRAVETIVVPDARYGKVLVLRDTQGITDAHVSIPPALVPIVARFEGRLTVEQIASEASRELGNEVPVALVRKVASDLDKALFLDSPQFHQAKKQVELQFRNASEREASHAGGAYHAKAEELETYLNNACLRPAEKKTKAHGVGRSQPKLAGLIAPHIDPWRGAIGYGHAYGALRRALSDDADTFILFGTSHAPMREHFALCKKDFATPLGTVKADRDAIDAIAAKSSFDAYADEFNHKREHSLEFQVVFLKHVLGKRPFRIIPILAGLGDHQTSGTDPAKDDHANRFLDSVAELIAKRGRRAVVVAGADLAHVGPRFGDAPLNETERRTLEVADRTSIDHAVLRRSDDFWFDVMKDLDTRKVCGLGPIYALLRTAPAAQGKVLHYEQTIDDDGSIVSHAAVGFYED